MNTSKKSLIIISSILVLGLFSCGENPSSSASSSSSIAYNRYSYNVEGISPTVGKIHRSSKSGTVLPSAGSINPFNTAISMTYYNQSEEDTAFEEDFSSSFQYYHALLDRHYYYVKDGEGLINNIRILNDSYGTGTPVKLDSDLYSSLKKSYGFSLASKGKFSIGVGNLSSLWDYYISSALYLEENPYYSDSVIQKRVLFTDPLESYVEVAKNTVPTSEELKTMLTFNDENSTVTFNAVSRIDEYVNSHTALINTMNNLDGQAEDADYSKPSITLGGYGKGDATQLFADKYPDRILLINSGASSVKCVGGKPNSDGWAISVANPYYSEAYTISPFSDITLNSADLVYFKQGSFNLSTSGYYNQYFYSKDSNDKYHLRSHIIDSNTGYTSEIYDSNMGEYHSYFASASVLLDDSGLADMYTTSLMNCTSLNEAMELVEALNTYTGQTAVPYFLVDTKVNGKKKTTCYIDSSLKGSFKFFSDAFPDYAESSYNITSIEVIDA